jgi:uncharacterized HAD superfamily protein
MLTTGHLENYMDRNKLYKKKREKKVVYFDIDGTLTNETEGWDYERRTPRLDVIERLREMYADKWYIVLWTARLNRDREVTKYWLEIHGIPYHELIMGKPYWDMYICDKSYNVDKW